MRLIDADKLKAHYAWWKGGTREMTMDEAKSDFDAIIDLQPTVEAEPNCGARMDLIGEDKSHPFAESVMMGMDGGEND